MTERWCDVCDGRGSVNIGEGSSNWRDYTGGVEQCRACSGTGRHRGGPSDSSFAWTVGMLTMPYVLVVVAAASWFLVISDLAEGYQQFLRTLYPGSLIGAEASHSARTIFAAALVIVVITGLLVLRLYLGRRWSRGSAGIASLRLSSFVLAFATAVVIILAPGLVFSAGVIVESVAAPPQGSVQPVGPIVVTTVAALWWSVRSNRRSVRKAVSRRNES